MSLFNYLLTIFGLLFVGIVLHVTTEIFLGISVFYLGYLLVTKQLFHYLDKKKLVKGDLVFIKYRGTYRKAYIKDIQFGHAHVQLDYADKSLNLDINKHSWYPMSRIVLPDYLSKAAKILYSNMED